jgi:hypothetical protein
LELVGAGMKDKAHWQVRATQAAVDRPSYDVTAAARCRYSGTDWKFHFLRIG